MFFQGRRREVATMRMLLTFLLLFVMIGCGSGIQPAKPPAESGGNQAQEQKVATPEKQAVTPAEKPPTVKPPDAAEVKKHMTPAQLALSDPIVNSVGMLLVPISAGEFQMGSPDSDSARVRPAEKPQHLVKIIKPFYLSVYEVTQQQYEKVMGVRLWQGKSFVQEGPDYPATYVSWNDAVEFCRKLSEQEGVNYITYRPKPSGSTLAVPEQPRLTALGMMRLSRESTLGTTRTLRVLARRTLTVSVRNCPIRGVCTTCTAMFWNYARTGTHPTAVRRWSVIRRGLHRANAVCCGAGRSSFSRSTSDPPTVTTIYRRTVTTPLVSVRRELTPERLYSFTSRKPHYIQQLQLLQGYPYLISLVPFLSSFQSYRISDQSFQRLGLLNVCDVCR